MSKLLKRHSQKRGLPPGTLMYLGEQRVEKTTIKVIDYDSTDVREHASVTPETCRPFRDSKTVTWIDVVGLHDTDVLKKIGAAFDLHPLTLEDIVSTGQRPTMEDQGGSLFLVLKMLYRRPADNEIVAEQVSLILADNYVLSFQEIEGDVFDSIRDRIQRGKGRIRGMGCDYLAYALLDAIVDNYFVVLENLGDEVERLQETVLEQPEPETLADIHRLKRDMVFLRKNLWPLRELVNGLEKSESSLISPDLRPYLRDVYEHTIQVIDTMESLRDMLTGALDIYMTTVSNRMNEVMKVLTVIATIFIPLTFIAGIYGMNFEVMPELHWRYGYAAVWGIMLLVGVSMVLFFRRRNWL